MNLNTSAVPTVPTVPGVSITLAAPDPANSRIPIHKQSPVPTVPTVSEPSHASISLDGAIGLILQ